MAKALCIASFILLLIINCQNSYMEEPNNSENEIPHWLKLKIDALSADPSYMGTQIFRYNYKEKYIYHIMIPVSSCAYCEVYDQNGARINIHNSTFYSDFLTDKTNEVLVWEYPVQVKIN